MDFDKAKEEIKARLPEYAAAVLTRSKGKDQYNCPFCGEILQSEWNEIQSCLSLYHQSTLIDCPLRLGFYICASNKNEAYARWNRRTENA